MCLSYKGIVHLRLDRCFASTTGRSFLRSVWVGASRPRAVRPASQCPVPGRKMIILEKLWREFFTDPSQWWDCRSEKVNPRYPDFKHKKRQDGLWLIDNSNPPWVEAELAAVAPRSLQYDIFSWNERLRRYAKADDYKKTMELFQQMQREGMDADEFTFLAVLNACSGLKKLEEGRRIHTQIVQAGYESDIFVGTSLVNMYFKCGSIEDARRVFIKMLRRDVVAWNAMILGYVKCGEAQEALGLSRQMQRERVDPDSGTFVAMLNACASVAALEEGRRVHKEIILRGLEYDVFVGSSLVDMYAKCGSIEDARRVFSSMPRKNVFTWTAMLAGFGTHGYAKEALEHFEKICEEDVNLNEVTFLSLMSACNHGGLVDEGVNCFDSMSAVHNIFPRVEHYACVVHLLGRAGRLHEAGDLIKNMPCEPNAAVWMSLLGACRIHGNVEMGQAVAKQVLKLDPENAAGYVLLSDIYAAGGRWDEMQMVHQERLERHVKRTLGRTWIEVKNEVHSFIVGDKRHPQIVEICAELKRLSQQMKRRLGMS